MKRLGSVRHSPEDTRGGTCWELVHANRSPKERLAYPFTFVEVLDVYSIGVQLLYNSSMMRLYIILRSNT